MKPAVFFVHTYTCWALFILTAVWVGLCAFSLAAVERAVLLCSPLSGNGLKLFFSLS